MIYCPKFDTWIFREECVYDEKCWDARVCRGVEEHTVIPLEEWEVLKEVASR